MACTTLLAGKKATYDGSTMIARNEDSEDKKFNPKKFVVVLPEQQPKTYTSVISHVQIDLPEQPQRYSAMPNADPSMGIWAASGVNESNVGMTATETITTNERVQGADPLLIKGPQGIGEEDFVVLTLPYIHTAREGVKRLGSLLEKYGTYEMNGIAFSDADEIWWMETIGGHHWIARRVPDDEYVVMPNQLGIDQFDLEDALGAQKEYMCSADMSAFISENHLNLSFDGKMNPRDCFGSHSDADHCYNTPRAWYMLRYFNPHLTKWDEPEGQYDPQADDLPWSMKPEKKVTIEDFKYVLSSHYQGTKYDPYGKYGDSLSRGAYRPIGINRNNFLSIIQIRPDKPEAIRTIEWIAFGSNTFNGLVPLYGQCTSAPEYFSNTGVHASTDNFYWANRIIGALADARFADCQSAIERYQMQIEAKGHAIIKEYDQRFSREGISVCNEAGQKVMEMAQELTQKLLDEVLYTVSVSMRNEYNRSDV